MKKTFYLIMTAVLILSSLSMFGAVFMDHDVHQRCPLAFLSSSTCKTVSDATASAFHHMSAYQSLTKVFVTSGTSILAALMFAVIFFFVGVLKPPRTGVDLIGERISVQERVSVSILDPILRWIYLHNKRNPHLPSWRLVA